MNEQYIYPQNLKAEAKLWLWSLKDLAILGIAMLISVLALSQIGLFLPMALTLVYGFLTIRLDDMTVLDFIKRGIRYFVTTQQYYEWKTASIGSHNRTENAEDEPQKESPFVLRKERKRT